MLVVDVPDKVKCSMGGCKSLNDPERARTGQNELIWCQNELEPAKTKTYLTDSFAFIFWSQSVALQFLAFAGLAKRLRMAQIRVPSSQLVFICRILKIENFCCLVILALVNPYFVPVTSLF